MRLAITALVVAMMPLLVIGGFVAGYQVRGRVDQANPYASYQSELLLDATGDTATSKAVDQADAFITRDTGWHLKGVYMRKLGTIDYPVYHLVRLR